MLDKITLEELVALRNTLNEMIGKSEEPKDFTTDHIEGIGDVVVDYTAKRDNKLVMNDIVNKIRGSEIITEINFDKIDVGTAFYGRFIKDDEGQFGELERHILVNSNTYTNNPEFISKTSPLGKAICGKKDNDIVFYSVKDEAGAVTNLVYYIDSIDRNRSHYLNNKQEGRAK